ncbi:WhiB family transcriptional regulator [Rhodococcus koreensis]|uniref:WhiB family transcriptional regulator n=1 Tax=Rhodococcus koreensis TaxID=99653 RepID=UPI001980F532|nr:WhiB family transcriptional regulator [Rhodococcus koreensis]QSE84899.1 WhiB family transcriptional regulator [Rhodococcus koreensis]
MLRLPSPIAESWDWQLSAACRDADPSVFFYADNERGDPRSSRIRAAKQVCRRCPVRTQCLDHALEARESHGIWGGYTEDERRTLQRPRDVDAHQLPSGREMKPRPDVAVICCARTSTTTQ